MKVGKSYSCNYPVRLRSNIDSTDTEGCVAVGETFLVVQVVEKLRDWSHYDVKVLAPNFLGWLFITKDCFYDLERGRKHIFGINDVIQEIRCSGDHNAKK